MPIDNEDLRMIQRTLNWPWYPILPVKRRNENGSLPTCGILVDGLGMTVYEKGVFELKTGLIKPQLEDCIKHEYSDVHALLNDGWVVD